ncbi:unnamed protein product [Polarella glacialis]|uniref:Uncharacterized protein n=1 Tax=Polarella glacialis TaxID=89957 RepID=A0A813J773_POLGL|nr:unnamed protein product [Polarella glacialis]
MLRSILLLAAAQAIGLLTAAAQAEQPLQPALNEQAVAEAIWLAYEKEHLAWETYLVFEKPGVLRELHTAALAAIRAAPQDFLWLEQVAPQLEAWAVAAETVSSSLPSFEAASCNALPLLLDELWETGLASQSMDVLLHATGLYDQVSFALGYSKCCRSMVEDTFEATLRSLYESPEPWLINSTSWRTGMFWRCSEWHFWGTLPGKIRSGTRGTLWEAVLKHMDYRLYGIMEPLTVQFAIMPRCVLRSLLHKWEAPFTYDRFFNVYSNCVPTSLAYAMDHLILSGNMRRAEEVFEIARSFEVRGSNLVDWTSLHMTGIHFLPQVAQWPWWQAHPEIKPYVDFLEEHFELLADEWQLSEQAPQYQEDLFPSTSRRLIWRGVDFWTSEAQHENAACALSPRICEALNALQWDGAELHINGTAVPFTRGKAIAWQDGWRHEASWEKGGGYWPDIYRHLLDDSSGKATLDVVSKTLGPWDRDVA